MNRPWRLAAIATLIAVTGCGGPAAPSSAPTAVTSLPPSQTASAAASPPSGGQASPKPDATSAQPAGPKIDYFRIKTKPSCPSSGPATSFPGNPIIVEWKVTGADKVTISIDGPGVYGTYDTTSQQELPFTCSGASGTIQKHRFLLKTVGGGAVRQEEITGEARIS